MTVADTTVHSNGWMATYGISSNTTDDDDFSKTTVVLTDATTVTTARESTQTPTCPFHVQVIEWGEAPADNELKTTNRGINRGIKRGVMA